MAPKAETIHLLILDPSQNDAEQLVSLLRNAGRATRAHRLTSEEDLLETLNAGSWDLALMRDSADNEELTPDTIVEHIQRLDKDIPAILLTEGDTPERRQEILSKGGHDAVPFDQPDLLKLVINRELSNLRERRQRRALSTHLHDAEQRCQLLLESSKDAIAYINDGMHVYANHSYMELLGYDDHDELICIPILDALASESQETFKKFMKDHRESGEEKGELSATVKRADGETLDVTMDVSPATYDGEPCTQIVVRPEQDNAELEERLREISSQDVLTGLYNRQHIMEQIQQTVARCQKEGTDGALAYISLDNFVHTKTQVGIAGADLIIGDMASILTDSVSDHHQLARLSDEAFCILSATDNADSLRETAETIRRKVENHLFDVSGRTVQLTVSIGITAITENAPRAEDVIGRAQTAADELRHESGNQAGNGVRIYTPQVSGQQSQHETHDAIQEALDNDRFRLLFQPVINLRGEGEEHYEAFVRMLDSDGREVSPYDFLPPGGPIQMASKIDRWVVLQTIKQLASHRSQGHETRLFLNLTSETIQDKTFPSWVGKVLKAARLPGDSLIFQISENDATTYLKQIKEFSRGLGELHCRLSISHFGGAINPFNTLKHLDVAYVKLDGSYTEEIQKSDEARENVREMIESLQQQGKLTVIPLVENASVLATLWQAGVNYIQGYYLQEPTPEMNYDFGEGE